MCESGKQCRCQLACADCAPGWGDGGPGGPRLCSGHAPGAVQGRGRGKEERHSVWCGGPWPLVDSDPRVRVFSSCSSGGAETSPGWRGQRGGRAPAVGAPGGQRLTAPWDRCGRAGAQGLTWSAQPGPRLRSWPPSPGDPPHVCSVPSGDGGETASQPVGASSCPAQGTERRG